MSKLTNFISFYFVHIVFLDVHYSHVLKFFKKLYLMETMYRWLMNPLKLWQSSNFWKRQ
jgi:hypothetical protein